MIPTPEKVEKRNIISGSRGSSGTSGLKQKAKIGWTRWL